ncbi:MAG: flagellar basal body P-ring protein FlgI [Planctomycetota bacterium]
MKRRAPLLLLSAWSAVALGCASSLVTSNLDTSQLDDVTRDEANLVSRYTHPYGLDYVQVEAVALVTGLSGTGGDPPPTPQREVLLEEMKRQEAPNPNKMLAADSTALVLVRGYLRPGMQAGDKFDVEVRTPSRSETTSLRGGWVLPVRLSEHAVLGQQVRTGHTLATAEGHVLVDPSADGSNALATRGRILGGAIAKKDRQMGLMISQEDASYNLAKSIGKAINARFHTYRDGRKTGVAKPQNPEFVQLLLHERYKENTTRFVKVVRNIAIRESAADLSERLGRLSTQLLDPLTTARAAIRLEAIGDERAVATLKRGAECADPEVRFYSAEALAYLDETAAVEPLAQAARDEPAFRVNALAALSAMDDVVAYEALRSLLSVRSAETRYGAFRALWAMDAGDAMIRGEQLGGQFSYHRLDIDCPPMIHVTRSYRPEIVLFGTGQQFQLPMVLDAGSNILVNGLAGSRVTVSRFIENEPTQKRVVSTSVDEVIRAIVELGGAYPDVVQALQQAKNDGALASSLRLDALPETGRAFDRSPPGEPVDPDDAGATPYRVDTPLPDLFSRKK